MADQLKRFLKLKQVSDLVALERTAIYEGMKNGTFPRAIPLGKLRADAKKADGHAVRWISSDIDEWMNKRIKAAQ